MKIAFVGCGISNRILCINGSCYFHGKVDFMRPASVDRLRLRLRNWMTNRRQARYSVGNLASSTAGKRQHYKSPKMKIIIAYKHIISNVFFIGTEQIHGWGYSMREERKA